MRRVQVCLLTLLILPISGGTVAAEEILAIKADRVDTVASGVIQNGVIVIHNGRITAVGTDVEIPDGADVIEALDKMVFPGLVSPYSHIGLSSASGGTRVIIISGRAYYVRSSGGGSGSNPHYRVVDELYPHQDAYKRILEAGFTTLALAPAGGTIAGQGAVVRPHGDTLGDMLVAESGLLMIQFRTGSAVNSLKSALESGKKQPTSTDPKVEPLARAVKGEIPVLIQCDAPADTLHLLKVLKPYDKMKVTLICGPENIHVAAEIAKRRLPVIVSAEIDYEPYTTNRMNVARTLSEAGIKIACRPVADSVQGYRDFLREMAGLVKAGLNRDVAKKAITLHPAEMLGLEYRIGSIEVGKDANLLILSGDPLDVDTILHRIILEGKTVYRNPSEE